MPWCFSKPPCFIEPEEAGDTGPVRVAQWYECGHIIQSSSLPRAPIRFHQILIASSTCFFGIAWAVPVPLLRRAHANGSCNHGVVSRPPRFHHCLRSLRENIVGSRKSDFHRCRRILPSEMAGLPVRISFARRGDCRPARRLFQGGGTDASRTHDWVSRPRASTGKRRDRQCSSSLRSMRYIVGERIRCVRTRPLWRGRSAQRIATS
ncbi:hypothetical protein QFZ94_006893 [Paraburkholderia sp. JPY465]